MEIITLPEWKAACRRWEGGYTELSDLKGLIEGVMEEMIGRADLEHVSEQWGFSYHTRDDGLVHYSGFQVDESVEIPSTMNIQTIPEQTYLHVQYLKEKNVADTYTAVYQWFKNTGRQPHREPGVEYYDDLPIKFEKYPVPRKMDHHDFDIYIPLLQRDY
ncbi:effector binding domain-containing protein [Halobacillus kuroshimensis]|uniref:effector binding domain-containing protein n=1 Tax=Halobacillus kuroshimensis TaxID=302481 RepID=UPI0003F50065|nr:effector binding domain-containing protein [Halobacillus kuroshimensis]